MSRRPVTVYVQGSSGSITKMDIPTNPHALGNYEAAIKSGDLRVVDPKAVEEQTTRHGGVVYVLREVSATKKPVDSSK